MFIWGLLLSSSRSALRALLTAAAAWCASPVRTELLTQQRHAKDSAVQSELIRSDVVPKSPQFRAPLKFRLRRLQRVRRPRMEMRWRPTSAGWWAPSVTGAAAASVCLRPRCVLILHETSLQVRGLAAPAAGTGSSPAAERRRLSTSASIRRSCPTALVHLGCFCCFKRLNSLSRELRCSFCFSVWVKTTSIFSLDRVLQNTWTPTGAEELSRLGERLLTVFESHEIFGQWQFLCLYLFLKMWSKRQLRVTVKAPHTYWSYWSLQLAAIQICHICHHLFLLAKKKIPPPPTKNQDGCQFSLPKLMWNEMLRKTTIMWHQVEIPKQVSLIITFVMTYQFKF